jgi:hypothetical protein
MPGGSGAPGAGPSRNSDALLETTVTWGMVQRPEVVCVPFPRWPQRSPQSNQSHPQLLLATPLMPCPLGDWAHAAFPGIDLCLRLGEFCAAPAWPMKNCLRC